ncbi:hypothetical protein AQ910_27490 [Burkholderia pseudomallei]|uniref:hypothetical protein n=1 Tax=Burkholderia pseudomallei TaxID=28450 RepID=UPI00053876DA|nr:hypothetical protein [Burkholderia pseudomallei]AJX20078.1 putative gp43 [Burkholderia pseudomallei MSHR491]KGW81886.1 putative gp43 [Burkholderia pseudomallei MSHR449]KGX74970.1 putative gp43 [Burkholderia pseudomallei MSHR435]ONC09729.1 hypothetical protein AQ910_27490 [Burkholderia pseudomallei]
MNDQQQSRADALTGINQFLMDVVTAAGLLSHGRTDKKLATRITDQAYELRKRMYFLAASPVEQPALLTAQDALAAIETFEIVGDNNDSREPNAEDRFILTEFVAHLFGGFRVELPAAAPADGACKRCGSTTAQACNDAGCFYLESGDGEPSAAPADERTASFEAWCDRFPEISAVERLRDAWQEARAAASPAAERVTAALQALSADVHTLGDGWANDEAMIGLAKKYLRVEPKPASPELSLWRDFVLLAVTDAAPQPARADAPAHAAECPHCDGEGVIEGDSGTSPCACQRDAQEGMPTFGARRAQADAPAEAFPYQKTFNAIAAATSVEGGHVSISVKAFRDAFGGAVAEAREPIETEQSIAADCYHWIAERIGTKDGYSVQEHVDAMCQVIDECADFFHDFVGADEGGNDEAVRIAKNIRALKAGTLQDVSAPADAGEAVAHMRVRSTDAGSTSHAIDIAPEAAALDLKPGEYLLYLAPPTTRAAYLTTTLSPDQRISMAAKLFCFANELLNGADQS